MMNKQFFNKFVNEGILKDEIKTNDLDKYRSLFTIDPDSLILIDRLMNVKTIREDINNINNNFLVVSSFEKIQNNSLTFKMHESSFDNRREVNNYIKDTIEKLEDKNLNSILEDSKFTNIEDRLKENEMKLIETLQLYRMNKETNNFDKTESAFNKIMDNHDSIKQELEKHASNSKLIERFESYESKLISNYNDFESKHIENNSFDFDR